MPNRLTDVRVRRVSFVKRAAVRDPSDPTQPRRFVLFKAEGDTPEREDHTMAVATDDDAASAAIARAVHELAPHEAHPAVKKALAAMGAEDDADGEHAVSKAIREMTTLSKAEGVPVDLRKRCDLASRQLQYEQLAKSNPTGAAIYAAGHPEIVAA